MALFGRSVDFGWTIAGCQEKRRAEYSAESDQEHIMAGAGAGMMGRREDSAERWSGQSGALSKCGCGGRRVGLEMGVGGVTEGVKTHQVFCVELELFF